MVQGNISDSYFISILCFCMQLLAADFLFLNCSRRRKSFVLRLVVGGLLFLALSLTLPLAVVRYVTGMRTFLILCFALGYMWFCYERSFMDILFCCVGAFTLQNLANNLQVIFCAATNRHFQMLSPEMLVIFPIVYAAGYFACARQIRKQKNISVNRLSVLLAASMTLVVCWILQAWLIEEGMDLMLISRLPLTICCVLSLFVQFGFLEKSRLNEEKAVLEQMLRENEKQYELSRRNIEVINMKCHDLKHRILELENEGGVNREQLEEISQAVDIYDSIAKTGNKALDIILSEKNLLCERYHIKFSYMMDGEKLNRIGAADIAAIFGNALDNAIECVQRIPDEDKRIISLIGYARADVLGIHMENYCEQELVFKNGLPMSTKGDEDNHGFGLKSIQYVVKKYGGNVVTNLENRIFSLDIIFPIESR